jgi:hypothetical protein
MEFQCRGHANGRLEFGPHARAQFMEFLRKNGPLRLHITPELPESGKLRRFFHGAVIPLWAYLDGKDYKDYEVRRDLHELAKLEFNGQIIVVHGETKKVGRSSKGAALRPFVEQVITYLEENYGIDRATFLDPADYKHFIGAIYMHGEYDTYIDYLLALKRLPSIKQYA